MTQKYSTKPLAEIITWVVLMGVAVMSSLYALFGHALIEAMYNGESWSFLNGIIRATRPLEHYFATGDWLFSGLGICSISGWILLMLLLDPARIESIMARMRRHRLASSIVGTGIIVGSLLVRWEPDPAIPWYMFMNWLALGMLVLGFTNDSTASSGGRAFAWSLLVILICFCAYFLFTQPALLNHLFAEDTFGENLSFLFLAFSGLTFLYLTVIMKGPDGRIQWAKNRFYLLFGLMLLFVAAEEISWGQRIIGFETPAGWPNRQDEANLHNLFNKDPDKFFSLSNALVSLLMIVLGLLVPIANRVSSTIRNLVQRFNIPVLSFVAAMFMIVGVGIHVEKLHSYYEETDEIRELFMSCGFIVFAVQTLESHRSRITRRVGERSGVDNRR